MINKLIEAVLQATGIGLMISYLQTKKDNVTDYIVTYKEYTGDSDFFSVPGDVTKEIIDFVNSKISKREDGYDDTTVVYSVINKYLDKVRANLTVTRSGNGNEFSYKVECSMIKSIPESLIYVPYVGTVLIPISEASAAASGLLSVKALLAVKIPGIKTK